VGGPPGAATAALAAGVRPPYHAAVDADVLRTPGRADPREGEGDLPAILRLAGRGQERTVLALALAGSLFFTLAAAVSSDSVFQVDEYFQVAEFTSYKLGITAPRDLPWEFAARIRPFTQPALYFGLARLASVAGVADPFSLLRLFRAASGLLSWLALATLMLAARSWFRDSSWRRGMYLSLGLVYFVPYLAARTSSESLSTTFLVFGLALLAPCESLGGERGPPLGWREVLAGLALGLAVECRYQVAMSVAGVLLWTLGSGRRRAGRVALLSLGIALALGAGLLADAWGYGRFELVPWNYFRVNVLEGKAATFGVLPLAAYPFVFLLLFPPFGAMLMVGLGLFWWRCRGHLLTFVTLPFFLGHSLIGHKEFRFMFPILLPAMLCLLLLWSRPAPASPRLAALLGGLRKLWFGRGTWALNTACTLALCFLPSSDNFGLQRYFYLHARDPVQWVGLTDPAEPHAIRSPFLWPKPRPSVRLVRTAEELERAVEESDRPVLVAAKFPLPAGAEAYLERRGSRVFVSLPPFLARLNLFHWVERADLTYVYRIELEDGAARGGASGRRR